MEPTTTITGFGILITEEDDVLSYLSSPMVKVMVGDGVERKTFGVHRELITSRSRYFQKELAKHSEGQGTQCKCLDGFITLSNSNPQVFGLYLQLLYRGRLPVAKAGEQVGNKALEPALKQGIAQEFNRIAELYVLCDAMQDVSTQGLLLSAFVEIILEEHADGKKWYPSAKAIGTLFYGTRESNPIRELLADLYVFEAGPEWLENTSGWGFHNEFMHKVMLGMLKERAIPSNSDWTLDASTYRAKLRVREDEDE